MSSSRRSSEMAPSLLMPPFANQGLRATTPPPVESPLPRTPRPQRFLCPPKTPLTGLQGLFATPPDFLQRDEDSGAAAAAELGMSIARPDSACSVYSTSSDSSVDSTATYTSTAGGSCTSVEDTVEEDFADAKGKQAASAPTPAPAANDSTPTQPRRRRVRKVHWTEEMDAHIWRTYLMIQQDPKMTPFPEIGRVPLGVCHKVARETKRTWKEARLSGALSSVASLTPQPRMRAPAHNKGDALRKANPHAFPASESAIRRRLRELCKQNYGPTRLAYNLQRAPNPPPTSGRESTGSPSPLKSDGLKKFECRDPFASTRSMALSLTTSTASSMRSGGFLAELAKGCEEAPPSPTPPAPAQIELPPPPALASFQPLSRRSSQKRKAATPADEDSSPVQPLKSTVNPLLPPLELKPLSGSSSHFGTWPRKRHETSDGVDEPLFPMPSRHKRRGTVHNLFADPAPTPATPAPPPARERRNRGYTISAGMSSGIGRRSARGPLLTVSGPVCYDESGAEVEGMGGAVSSPLSTRRTRRPAGMVSLDMEMLKSGGSGEGEEQGSSRRRRLGSPFGVGI